MSKKPTFAETVIGAKQPGYGMDYQAFSTMHKSQGDAASKIDPASLVDAGVQTRDGFNNFAAKIGLGAETLASDSTYSFNFITRNRQQLEAMYRGSWLVGMAVDAPAEDMTRAGITIQSTLKPDKLDRIYKKMTTLGIWTGISEAIRWGRLFGGAIAVILIEGQDLSEPLRIKSVGKDQFKGLVILDRWMCQPSLGNLVTTYGPDLGKPMFYEIVADAPALPRMKIHHSRCIRFEGVRLPYFQRLAENLWSESVVERIYDRLVAFDSTTLGAAQLVYRSHLRTLKVKGYRQIVSQGGPALLGLARQIEMMRIMQCNESITLMDADDSFESHQYTFSGLSDVLMHFGEQVSGAVEVPIVRLFGQSPAGLNSTGESDLRTYYDNTNKKQETDLRNPVQTLIDILCYSVLGEEPPELFTFTFNPLWLASDAERAELGAKVTGSVISAYEAGLVRKDTALKELQQASQFSSLWSNIREDEIQDAVNAPPPQAPGMPPQPGMQPQIPSAIPAPASPGQSEDPSGKMQQAVEPLTSESRMGEKVKPLEAGARMEENVERLKKQPTEFFDPNAV